MRVLITGAAGMIGRKLTARLIKDGRLNGRPIEALHLLDVVAYQIPLSPFRIEYHKADGAEFDLDVLISGTKPHVVFHLAGIVSGEAEANFDLGYDVNLRGTWALFEALRKAQISPRVVFTSSIAVFGAPFPAVIPDDFHLTPLTSYGTQKMMSEALLADYTRKGLIDGIGIRLPTICVRPGTPNKAASGFFSNIIREPLVGLPAVLPVPEDVVHTHASPRSAIKFLLHAAGLDGATIGPRRNLTMPGVGVSVAEMIAALRSVAGDKAANLITEVPDATIWSIVQNWPTRFEAKRSRDLGFAAENSFEEIVQAHIDDELGGRIAK